MNCTTSYGIIAYKIVRSDSDQEHDLNETLRADLGRVLRVPTLHVLPVVKFLVIQRKDTFGFIDLIRGKWDSLETAKRFIEEITPNERIKLLTRSFDQLWSDLWMNENCKAYRSEYAQAKRKFYDLGLPDLLSRESDQRYLFTEYTFPKGRQRGIETGLATACREFQEETGVKSHEYTLLASPPVTETFIGTNGIRYKHVYYIAEMQSDYRLRDIDATNVSQAGEVGNLGFVTCREYLNLLRDYDYSNKSKRDVVSRLHQNLVNTCLRKKVESI
jgi:8-oxo-dGTP pyrophosphatase MutT (NUDIX family)